MGYLKTYYMNIVEQQNVSFNEYVESIATEVLTDNEYELEYQGLFINDKIRYLVNKGINLIPLAAINGINL